MPVRTCVVTRKRYDAAELIRLQVDAQGVLTLAPAPGGRGAWVRPEHAVIQKLQARPGMVRRSLRCSVQSTDGLVDRVRAHLLAELAHCLTMAWRSGTLRLDTDRSPPDALRLVVSDSGTCAPDAIMLPWSRAQLGALLCRPQADALVALPSRPTRRLLSRLRRWRCLGYPPSPLATAS